MLARAIERAALGAPLADEEALELAESRELAPLAREAAAAARNLAFGRRVTFSPKVFLPLTNLCRNRCSYCSFRRSPGDAGAWTMTPDELSSWLARARAADCGEALFCLGDKPESAFSSYRDELASFGQASTVDYLVRGAEMALEHGLLPHTNAGILTRDDMQRLKRVNVSLGLMLENVSERLCAPGMPHHKAPDKRPAKRLQMIAEAGELRIPFTTGILVGIGETMRERVESLLAIRALSRTHGHVQEVIVQNFRAHPATPMADATEPSDEDIAFTVAVARLVLDADVSLQAPPNLNPASAPALLAAGLDDFGGISPVTPDYINPRHPWPHLEALGEACARAGFTLRPRSPIYERFAAREGFVEPALVAPMRATMARLAATRFAAPPRDERRSGAAP